MVIKRYSVVSETGSCCMHVFARWDDGMLARPLPLSSVREASGHSPVYLYGRAITRSRLAKGDKCKESQQEARCVDVICNSEVAALLL